MSTDAPDQQIRDIQQRLFALGREQRELTALLENLQQQKQAPSELSQSHHVNINPDVFPKRWDNAKTGRSGYSPVCKNEWAKGICNRPRIPCSACTYQAWTPVIEDVIRKHLCGDTSGWQPCDYIRQ